MMPTRPTSPDLHTWFLSQGSPVRVFMFYVLTVPFHPRHSRAPDMHLLGVLVLFASIIFLLLLLPCLLCFA